MRYTITYVPLMILFIGIVAPAMGWHSDHDFEIMVFFSALAVVAALIIVSWVLWAIAEDLDRFISLYQQHESERTEDARRSRL
jgi:fumarate reductase subunit D